GNAVSFLLTSEVARMLGARIRLRIDDLDAERARAACVDDIFASLRWLGIAWQEGPADRQSHERDHSQAHRMPRYLHHLHVLKEQGDLYACACSRSAARRRPCDCRGKGLPFDAPNVAWRLRVPADALVRMEGIFHHARWLSPAELLPDPVLRQRAEAGGRPAYQIASLIDDADHGITHIVRGEDLLPSTACQLYLADRLCLAAFQRVRFLHHPLITDEQGRKLSKSEGAASLKAMRAAGVGPDALRRRAGELLLALREGAPQSSSP
ncbi:MAG: glutamate--tRNA ligase family protein, partial [Flavobacteriales bacterium]